MREKKVFIMISSCFRQELPRQSVKYIRYGIKPHSAIKMCFKCTYNKFSRTNKTFMDKRVVLLRNRDQAIKNIWSIGGKNGWYAYNWAWQIRGFIDTCIGGVGMRGRKISNEINEGDYIDFWRVLKADKKNGELLLSTEMKAPGKGFLHFKVDSNQLTQIATFHSHGLLGDAYWYALLPFHKLIYSSLAFKICNRL